MRHRFLVCICTQWHSETETCSPNGSFSHVPYGRQRRGRHITFCAVALIKTQSSYAYDTHMAHRNHSCNRMHTDTHTHTNKK